jgi:PAS domain S-box-containing protein
MIWVDGADGGCEFVNKAYLDFFGATLDEVRGFGWNQRVHPDDADAYLRAFLTAFAAREPFRAEVRLQAANGAMSASVPTSPTARLPRRQSGRASSALGNRRESPRN